MVEKSSSLKNLSKDNTKLAGSPTTGKPPSQLNKNSSQRAENFSPMNTTQEPNAANNAANGVDSQGKPNDGKSQSSSIKR